MDNKTMPQNGEHIYYRTYADGNFDHGIYVESPAPPEEYDEPIVRDSCGRRDNWSDVADWWTQKQMNNATITVKE